jgi:hypothetical protein
MGSFNAEAAEFYQIEKEVYRRNFTPEYFQRKFTTAANSPTEQDNVGDRYERDSRSETG